MNVLFQLSWYLPAERCGQLLTFGYTWLSYWQFKTWNLREVRLWWNSHEQNYVNICNRRIMWTCMKEHTIWNYHVWSSVALICMFWKIIFILLSFYPLADKRSQWQILYFTLVVIAALFGVALWIAVGVVVSNGSKSGLHVTSLFLRLYQYQNMLLILIPIFSDYILLMFNATPIQYFKLIKTDWTDTKKNIIFVLSHSLLHDFDYFAQNLKQSTKKSSKIL